MERQYIFFHTLMGLTSFALGILVWAFAFTSIAAGLGPPWLAIFVVFSGAIILVLLSFKVDKWFRQRSE